MEEEPAVRMQSLRTLKLPVTYLLTFIVVRCADGWKGKASEI